MKIIINGCGKIGRTVLKSLANEGHDIVAIDTNPEVITELTNIYDVMGVCGNGTDSDVLQEAGVANAQLVASFTNSDELNMLTCFLAKKLGASHTIARIRNPEYNDASLAFMKQQLEISFAVNPELMAAREIFNILQLPSAVNVETFSVRNFEMIELKLKADSALDNLKISDLRSKHKAKYLICAVQRGENAYIPDGNFVLKSGDKIGVCATPAEILKFMKEMGVQQNPAKKIMILGGGSTAYYLAKQLSNLNNSITIIEKNQEICHKLCEAFPKAVVVNGDGTNQEVLIEEGVGVIDALVSITGMDEQNILMSAYAQNKGVPKVITKINRGVLVPMADNWGLDTIITPKKIVSDVLLKYARALENSQGSSVETLYRLMDNKVEALEFVVKDGLDFLGVSFKDLNLKPNILIAGIIRDRRTIIPSGDDMLLAGDKVVVLAANQRINNLSDIKR